MKNKKIYFIILLLLAAMIIFRISFKYESIGYISDSKYFKGRLMGYSITGIKYGYRFKITGLTKGKARNLGIMNIKNKKYIVFIIDNKIKLYSVEGKLIEKYKIGQSSQKIFSSCICDIEGDGSDEILFIIGNKGDKYGENLVKLSYYNGFKRVDLHDFTKINPWKVQVADIDGDGNIEISVGVYKTTRFHPVMAKRPFIYGIKSGYIYPKWRGSRLSRPFDDYIFANIDDDNKDELISIELLQNGKKVINSYKWKGFGIEGFAQSIEFDDIFLIIRGDKNTSNIIAKVKLEDEIKWAEIIYQKGKLVIKNVLKNYMPKLDNF